MKKQIEIDPKRFYTLGEMVKEGIIPGLTSVPMASRMVENDKRTNNYLQAMKVVRGVNGGIMYKIQGKNIINFLVQRENV